MEETENIALFDMDSTLCDYDKAMKRDYNLIKSPEDPPYISFGDVIKNTPHLKNRIKLIRNQPGWWKNLEKLKLGFDILEIARKLGFEIHILTKGPKSSPNSWTEKVEWVKENVLDANITITENKGLVYGKILVDDYPIYIKQWLKSRPRGLVIMPVHEFNKNFQYQNMIPYNGTNLAQIEKAFNAVKKRKPNEVINYQNL